MIRDIDVWLQELSGLSADFQEACNQNDDFEIERTLYYSALVVRKFSETPFVRRGFLGLTIDCQTFMPACGAVDGLNWTDARSHFDFSSSIGRQVSLLEICNTLIHSRFLEWSPAEGPVERIFAAGGMRAGIESIGFTPRQYAGLLDRITAYKFKRMPLRPTRRTA
jgi:hypothetical protein